MWASEFVDLILSANQPRFGIAGRETRLSPPAREDREKVTRPRSPARRLGSAMNWNQADERLKKLHADMCAAFALVIRARLDRDKRIAELARQIAHKAGATFHDETRSD